MTSRRRDFIRLSLLAHSFTTYCHIVSNALKISFLLEKGITQRRTQFVPMAKQHGNIIELLQNVLRLPQELGHRKDDEKAYGNLANACKSLGDFQQAIQYIQKDLQITKGRAYGNLVNAYRSLGDFQQAIQYHQKCLQIAKDLGDRAGEGSAYGNLGNAYRSLGDFQQAIQYHQKNLQIAKDLGDRAGEGRAYGNLGNAYQSLGDFQQAMQYHQKCLQIAKDLGDRAVEGGAYGNLGNAYRSLGDFQQAMQYHQKCLQIAKDLGDRAGEGRAYGSLGNAYQSLGDFQQAIQYHQKHLEIAKDLDDRAGEGRAFGNLGNSYRSRGDFQQAIQYHHKHLQIAKDLGDRAEEGGAYGNLGNAYRSLGDFQQAIQYHHKHLQIAKDLGDRAGEGRAYGNLGNAYDSLGDFQQAMQYHQKCLQIALDLGDRAGEGGAYGNLGNAYQSLGNFQQAIKYHQEHLQIAKDLDDRAGEGRAYGNLGNAYRSHGDFQQAIQYHQKHLQIAKDLGDRVGEGDAYGNLGNAYNSLGDFQQAIQCHQKRLPIAKEVGSKVSEASSYYSLGCMFQSLAFFSEAIDSYRSSVTLLDTVRALLHSKDSWKRSFRELHHKVYSALWRCLLISGKNDEALCAAEQGRAQALIDMLMMQYGFTGLLPLSCDARDTISYFSRVSRTQTVFLATEKDKINIWVLGRGNEVVFRQGKIENQPAVDDPVRTLLETAFEKIGAGVGVRCENRTIDELTSDTPSTREERKTTGESAYCTKYALQPLYDVIISPIADVLLGDELVIVPDGSLCLAPWAALSEDIRIRTVPSLTSLKLITSSPKDFHSNSGALLVGDPCVEKVPIPLEPLPYAKKEVEMIGEVLKTQPLTGKEATKVEVLKRMTSVGLVHIAAHGRKETGEIVFAPNPGWTSEFPEEKDFMLNMSDVQAVRLRASLVVLSCCQSGRGEVLKSEGVVGLGRAFLCAGARSVLVALWDIEDEATLEFMKSFYQHLREAKSTSLALHQAMKSLRDSEKFSSMRHWAPFVLIGDDVTLEFDGKK